MGKPRFSIGKLMALMALFVLVGVPMVAYLWETLNELMALQARPIRLLIAVPVLLVFAGLLKLLADSVRRWETDPLS